MRRSREILQLCRRQFGLSTESQRTSRESKLRQMYFCPITSYSCKARKACSVSCNIDGSVEITQLVTLLKPATTYPLMVVRGGSAGGDKGGVVSILQGGRQMNLISVRTVLLSTRTGSKCYILLMSGRSIVGLVDSKLQAKLRMSAGF